MIGVCCLVCYKGNMVMNTYDEDMYVNYESSTEEIDKKFWEYFETSSVTSFRNITIFSDIEPRVPNGPILATYSILFIVGAVGNLAVLGGLSKSRRRKSRVDLLMTHLALADVCVTCGVIPLEIGWKYTNAWLGGNALCKIMSVLRAFGLYLSSNVLVCISIDRFFAVIYPLRLPVARRRSRQMLSGAWFMALTFSLPQSVVFSVRNHPYVEGFEQCVSFGTFSTVEQEIAYNAFCLGAMYFAPLVIITVCYLCIFCEIHKNSKELDDTSPPMNQFHLRRNGRRLLERARRRTLRMTVTIVCVFALCWLPYATMAIWSPFGMILPHSIPCSIVHHLLYMDPVLLTIYIIFPSLGYMVDRSSASSVSPRVQDMLFAMAVSNSCMNPLVYGSYALDLRGAIRRLLKNTCCVSSSYSDTIGNSGSSSTKNKNQHLEAPLMLKNGRIRPRLGVRFAETSLTAATSEPRHRAPS